MNDQESADWSSPNLSKPETFVVPVYDKEQHRDAIRKYLICGMGSCVVFMVLFLCFMEFQNHHDVVVNLQPVNTAVMTLFSSMVGFYFGREK